MDLTSDQLKAIENGEPVPVVINNTECVVVRRDVYERSQDWSIAETYELVERVLDQEPDPGLDSYQEWRES